MSNNPANRVLLISDMKAPIREKWVLENNNFKVQEGYSTNLKINEPVTFVLLVGPLRLNFQLVIKGIRSIPLLKVAPVLVITNIASELNKNESNIYFLSQPYQDTELAKLSCELTDLSRQLLNDVY